MGDKMGSKWMHRLSNIDNINKRATCSNCGYVSIWWDGKSWRCRVALKSRRRKHGYSGIGYGYREGICPICNKDSYKLVQDHNHVTEELRGWICTRCNTCIGFIENGADINNINNYLNKYNKTGS